MPAASACSRRAPTQPGWVPSSPTREDRDKLACCTRRPAAAGGRETSNGVPTRVEVRSEAFSDAGSTPAASTIYQHEVVEPSGSGSTRSLTQVPDLGGSVSESKIVRGRVAVGGPTEVKLGKPPGQRADPTERAPTTIDALRREILDRVYALYLEKPAATAIWHADRSDPDRAARMREAEYLRDLGLIKGQIGADGGLALKLTSKGRDHIEREASTQPAAPTSREAKQSPAKPSAHSESDVVDFVIITALEEERDAVLGKLPGHRKLDKESGDVRTYYEGSVETRRADGTVYRVIVTCLSDAGPQRATSAASAVANRWHPKQVLLVGIACGVPAEANHGDVLVPNQVADYSLTKIWPDGRKEIRWEVHRASANLLDSATNLGAGDWTDLIAVKRPGDGVALRRGGVVASGGDVVSNDEVIANYQADWPKLVGVEMEGGGTATGLHESADRPEFLMVKAVSDHGKDKPDPAVKPWRPYACDAAAAFAIGLIRSGPKPGARTRAREVGRDAGTSGGANDSSASSSRSGAGTLGGPDGPRGGSAVSNKVTTVGGTIDRVRWRLSAKLTQSLMARRGELLAAIEQSRVVFHLDLPRLGTQRLGWPACFQEAATAEDNPRAFVWTGKTGARGQDVLRMFDDGTLIFERRTPPPARTGDLVTVDFDTLAEDIVGFVRLCAGTYSRASKTAGTSAVPFTVELKLELPTGRDAVAMFKPGSYVQAIDFMRTPRIKRSTARSACTVPPTAAVQADPVATALVRLLGGIADEFDLASDGITNNARVLRLKEEPLRQLVIDWLPPNP